MSRSSLFWNRSNAEASASLGLFLDVKFRPGFGFVHPASKIANNPTKQLGLLQKSTSNYKNELTAWAKKSSKNGIFLKRLKKLLEKARKNHSTEENLFDPAISLNFIHKESRVEEAKNYYQKNHRIRQYPHHQYFLDALLPN